MFTCARILFLVSLLFVALFDPFDPYSPFKFFINLVYIYIYSTCVVGLYQYQYNIISVTLFGIQNRILICNSTRQQGDSIIIIAVMGGPCDNDSTVYYHSFIVASY